MARRTGQIEKLGRDRWRVRVSWMDAYGRRRTRSKSVSGKRSEAEEALGALRKELDDRGEIAAPRREPVSEFLTRWLRDVAPVNKGERELGRLESLFRVHVEPVIGDLDVHKLRPAAIQRVVSTMVDTGKAPSTIRATISNLRAALRHGVDTGELPQDPTKGIKLPPKPRGRKRIPSQEELRQLLSVAESDPRFQNLAALWVVMAGTGARTGELLGLRWSDVDMERGLITIQQVATRDRRGRPQLRDGTKNGDIRSVSLPSRATEALRRHRRRQAEHALRSGGTYDRSLDLVFANRVGGLVDPMNLRRRSWDPLIRAAGLDGLGLTPHGLRHAHVSHLMALGVDVAAVASRVGHRDHATTFGVYTQAVEGASERAVAAAAELLGD